MLYFCCSYSHLLESIRRCKPDAKFYQASSSEVFGQPDTSPQNERTAFRASTARTRRASASEDFGNMFVIKEV
ncbi:MAG: GDP-mannose 4,6-dehydratase [Gloeotrichia echinulata GP01]